MTNEEAQRFADTMRESYPNGPTARVWRSFAIDERLDFDLCLVAYRRCRREHAYTSIAVGVFWEQYRSARSDADRDRRRDDPPRRCELCDGGGWVDGPEIVHNAGTTYERRSSTSTPCVCSVGRQRVDVHRRMVDANSAA